MTTALIEKKLSTIPSEYLNEVSIFLDYLSYKIAADKQHSLSHIKRTPGIMKGDIYIADDFDSPLDDFKEYM